MQSHKYLYYKLVFIRLLITHHILFIFSSSFFKFQIKFEVNVDELKFISPEIIKRKNENENNNFLPGLAEDRIRIFSREAIASLNREQILALSEGQIRSLCYVGKTLAFTEEQIKLFEPKIKKKTIMYFSNEQIKYLTKEQLGALDCNDIQKFIEIRKGEGWDNSNKGLNLRQEDKDNPLHFLDFDQISCLEDEVVESYIDELPLPKDKEDIKKIKPKRIKYFNANRLQNFIKDLSTEQLGNISDNTLKQLKLETINSLTEGQIRSLGDKVRSFGYDNYKNKNTIVDLINKFSDDQKKLFVKTDEEIDRMLAKPEWKDEDLEKFIFIPDSYLEKFDIKKMEELGLEVVAGLISRLTRKQFQALPIKKIIEQAKQRKYLEGYDYANTDPVRSLLLEFDFTPEQIKEFDVDFIEKIPDNTLVTKIIMRANGGDNFRKEQLSAFVGKDDTETTKKIRALFFKAQDGPFYEEKHKRGEYAVSEDGNYLEKKMSVFNFAHLLINLFSPKQVSCIDFFWLLSENQIKEIKLEQLKEINGQNIKYFGTNIQYLPEMFIKNLNKDQVSGLNAAQVQVLTDKKLLSPDKIKSVNTMAIKDLKGCVVDLGPEYTKKLTKEQINALSDNEVYDLRKHNLISDSQIMNYSVKEDSETGKTEAIQELQHDESVFKFWMGFAISATIPIIGNVVYLLYQNFKANSLLNKLKNKGISVNPFKKIKVEATFQKGKINATKDDDRENKNINDQEK